MTEIIIVPTIREHIKELSLNLREEDKKEIAGLGSTSAHALWRSYKGGVIRKTAIIDGSVGAAWGCCGNLMGRTGQPWLLTSPAVKKISSIKFAKIYKAEVDQMLLIFPKLVNYVDASYTAAVRLLSLVGFTLGDPESIGNGSAMYRKFELGA